MRTNITILSILLASILLLNSCEFAFKNSIIPSKNLITKEVQTDGFDKIISTSIADIIYKQSPNTSVVISGPDNLVALVDINVKDNSLKVYTKEKINKTNNLKIIISSPSINKIVSSGVGEIQLNDKIEGDELDIQLNGVGNIQGKSLHFDNIKVKSSGIGKITLGGVAKNAELSLDGIGDIRAYSLHADKLTVTQSGIGSIECNAQNELIASLKSIGNIKYKGKPAEKNIIKRGIGQIKSVD